MYDVEVAVREIHTADDLIATASGEGSWDIVYACGRGDAQGLGEATGDKFFGWAEISEALCTHLAEDA